jgi:acetate kinase
VDPRARRGRSGDPQLDLAALSPPVLVVNPGSTSLKLSVVRGDNSTEVDSLEAAPQDLAAVAHRVVHGGDRFREPVLIDDEIEAALRGLVELAPIHNTAAVEAIDAARRLFPGLPHVAVFDTAFHATIPAEAATYALPERFRAAGIRRYGFHGLSVQWAAERVPAARLVVCHLGGGCSVTAVRDGRSVDTSMGFTPLEGVPMATRSGSVDPGALLHLLRHGVAVDELERALEHESGLRGLSGLDSVRELEARGSPEDRLALDVFTYRIACTVAAMATALQGIDALVFTAGVGEHSAGVRARVCARLRFLGVELDAQANRDATPDVDVQAPGADVRVAVIRAREDVVAARAARALLDAS